MAIQTSHDTGDDYQVTPKLDGGLYAAAISDCVCKGIGDEFTMNYTNDSLIVTFNAGSQAVIGGAFFKITSTHQFTFAANTTCLLCAEIDLGQQNGNRGTFKTYISESVINKDNLNGSGVKRDLILYQVTTGANGITSVQDKRIIKGDGGAFIGDLDMTNINILSNGGIPYTTTVPSAANPNGLKIVYCTSKPATLYSGYLYLVKES